MLLVKAQVLIKDNMLFVNLCGKAKVPGDFSKKP